MWLQAIAKNATAAKKKTTKMANHSIMEGHLQKLGGKMKGKWQKRYFVLFNRKMQYFSSDKVTASFRRTPSQTHNLAYIPACFCWPFWKNASSASSIHILVSPPQPTLPSNCSS